MLCHQFALNDEISKLIAHLSLFVIFEIDDLQQIAFPAPSCFDAKYMQ